MSQDSSAGYNRRIRKRAATQRLAVRNVRPRYSSSKMSNRMVPSSKVHEFHRHCESTLTTTNAGLVLGGIPSLFFSLQFNLYDVTYLNGGGGTTTQAVPGYLELVGLFDSIMLQGVKVEIRAIGPSTNAGALGNTATFGLATDFNDATPTASQDALREYDSYKLYQISDQNVSPQCVRYIKPCYLQTINYGVLLNGYKSSRGYLSSQIGSVPHYGMKGIFSAIGNSQVLHFSVRYNYLCKNVK